MEALVTLHFEYTVRVRSVGDLLIIPLITYSIAIRRKQGIHNIGKLTVKVGEDTQDDTRVESP